MKVLQRMLVLDRLNSDRPRLVPVIAVRRITPAETNVGKVLSQDARTHAGRLSLPVR